MTSCRRALRERGGHRRLGGEDDRLGGHQTTGGVLVVDEEAAHVLGLVGLHQLEQLARLLRGQLGDQVGGVIGLHLVEHLRRALSGQGGEDRDPVLVTELLEHVRQADVGQCRGDFLASALGQVVQHVGEVGGLEVVHRGQQRRGALLLRRRRQAGHLGGVHHLALPSHEEPAPAAVPFLPHEQLGHQPVPVPLLLQPDILDGDLLATVAQGDHAVQQLAHHQRLRGPALEPSQIQQPVRDDSAGIDGGDAGEREEDAPLPGHLHDQADGAGCLTYPEQHHDVMHPADTVPERVEDADAGEARDEDAARGGAHGCSLCQQGVRVG